MKIEVPGVDGHLVQMVKLVVVWLLHWFWVAVKAFSIFWCCGKIDSFQPWLFYCWSSCKWLNLKYLSPVSESQKYISLKGLCPCSVLNTGNFAFCSSGRWGFVIPTKNTSCPLAAHKQCHCSGDWWTKEQSDTFFFTAALLPLPSEKTAGNPQEILPS